jgi:S2P endopeptidase
MISPGLHIGDEITTINNCQIRNIKTWYTCLQSSIQIQPAYCVSNEFLHSNDESVPIFHDDNGLIECCDIKNTKANCFECILDKEDDIIELPQHMCLEIRKTIESASEYCNNAKDFKKCSNSGRHCFKPILNNSTTILHVKRKNNKDVVYIGHPKDVTQTVEVSEFVPKTRIFTPWLADATLLLLKYITVFSMGLAFVNVIPCFGFDGQHIFSCLFNSCLNKCLPQKSQREMIALCVNIIGTMLLMVSLLKLLWSTLSNFIF